jgi:hypothetical protein
MKKTFAASAVALAVLASMGASCDSTATVSVENFRANLTGQAAVPPTSTGSAGTANAVLAPLLNEIAVSISHVIDPADVTRVTLNAGIPGQTGGAYFNVSPTVARGQWTVSLTEADFTPQGNINTFTQFWSVLRAGQVYVNVETRQHPTGEIRAQLVRL